MWNESECVRTGGSPGTVQYAKSTSNVAPADATAWQAGTTFNSLSPGTTYYFFARITGGTTYADATSAGLEATTKAAPAATLPRVGDAAPVALLAAAVLTSAAVLLVCLWKRRLRRDG